MAREVFVGRYVDDSNDAKASRGSHHPHERPELVATVSGVTELAADGFVRVEKLVEGEDVVAALPKARRCTIEETRYELTGLEPSDKRWGYSLLLVRSPWPEVGPDEDLMRARLGRHRDEMP